MLPRFLPLTIYTMRFSLFQSWTTFDFPLLFWRSSNREAVSVWCLFCPTNSHCWFNEPSGGGARVGLADVADKYCISVSVWFNCEFDAERQSYNLMPLQQSIALAIRTSEWQQGPAALVACLTSLLWLIIAINKINSFNLIFTLTRRTRWELKRGIYLIMDFFSATMAQAGQDVAFSINPH